MSLAPNPNDLFFATTPSTRQLYTLLKCISFSPTTQIQISHDGIRATVEDLRIMQGHAFIDRKLFSVYIFNPRPVSNSPPSTADTDDDPTLTFTISLQAFLECLQMFSSDPVREKHSADNSIEAIARLRAGMELGSATGTEETEGMERKKRTFAMRYMGEGYPLVLTIDDHDVTTDCSLVTYEPDIEDDIPLARDALAQKIIMKASWLHDAILELEAASATQLTMTSSPSHPFLTLSSAGPLGSTKVEFGNDKALLETFNVPELIRNEYKFSMVRHASRAMSIATKVSIRGDKLGVLSMQFMIEGGEGGTPNFIDFRFLPSQTETSDTDD